jgi:hypothetical protein
MHSQTTQRPAATFLLCWLAAAGGGYALAAGGPLRWLHEAGVRGVLAAPSERALHALTVALALGAGALLAAWVLRRGAQETRPHRRLAWPALLVLVAALATVAGVHAARRAAGVAGDPRAAADPAAAPAPRTLAAAPPFERGGLRELEPEVWLIPAPTAEELAGRFPAAAGGTVVVLLDGADPGQAAWIAALRARLADGGGALLERPWPQRRADAGRAAAIVAEVRAAPRPVVVVVPFTEPLPHTRVAEAFVQAYLRPAAH